MAGYMHVVNDDGSCFEIRRDSGPSDPRSRGICRGRSVTKGPGTPRRIYISSHVCSVTWPPLPGSADYKISFLPGECLRISNKAVILFPSRRTTRPCRGVGFFSFFVYSPANWFCGIHARFPPSRPGLAAWSTSSASSSSSSGSSDKTGRRVRLFRGT